MQEQLEQVQLAERIADTIAQIKSGATSPKDSGIGKLFSELRLVDYKAYLQLSAEYKPVASSYFEQNPDEKRFPNETDDEAAKRVIRDKKADRAEYKKAGLSEEELNNIGLGSDLDTKYNEDGYEYDYENSRIFSSDIDDDYKPQSKRTSTMPRSKSPVNKERVAKVRAINPLKVAKPKGDRDRKSFLFEGAEYGKGPLVLKVVGVYVANNPGITYAEVKKAFPDNALRSYGIIKSLAEAIEISKARPRYFMKEVQLIQLADCQIAVCNQFTSDNILPFLDLAKGLGFTIE